MSEPGLLTDVRGGEPSVHWDVDPSAPTLSNAEQTFAGVSVVQGGE